MRVKTSDLPGIGKRYAISTAQGGEIVIILHSQGNREIYYFKDPDDGDPDVTLALNDEEARQIGTILLGVDYQPVTDERMEFLLNNIRIDWVEVRKDSCLANQKIIDAKIRTRTGATIIGIQRGNRIIGSPDINEVMRPGDILMVIGTLEQTRAVEAQCKPT